MSMEIVFTGGKKIEARFDGLVVKTDQPKDDGGEGTAPAPFDLFLTSLGTCAGFYALSFCQERDISTEGMKIVLDAPWDEEAGLVKKVSMKINLPSGFPEKYKLAIVKAAELCTVTKHLQSPPIVEVDAA